MTLTEADRIARSRAIDALYRQHLGRPIDPNGVSYACSDLTLEEVEAILKWGELPPQLMIADGWDDGRWPMLLPGMTPEQQDLEILRMKQLHRNTAVLLAVNPDANNPPVYGPTIDVLLPAAAAKCEAAGLRVAHD